MESLFKDLANLFQDKSFDKFFKNWRKTLKGMRKIFPKIVNLSKDFIQIYLDFP